MNTQFIRKAAGRHGKTAGWGATIGSIVLLGWQVYSESDKSANNHRASWDRINALEQRIETLEKQHEYEAGRRAGMTESLTPAEKAEIKKLEELYARPNR